jgi:hypothetical protein
MYMCLPSQVLWQAMAHTTALVFAGALRRIQQVQAQMDLPPRWLQQGGQAGGRGTSESGSADVDLSKQSIPLHQM